MANTNEDTTQEMFVNPVIMYASFITAINLRRKPDYFATVSKHSWDFKRHYGLNTQDLGHRLPSLDLNSQTDPQDEISFAKLSLL
jgi:hypothetical protein